MNLFTLSILLMIGVLVRGATSGEAECTNGEFKKMDCNNCYCSNGLWTCTRMLCPTRKTRDVPVASELKNTPCAPNDYFKIDCNTCYCNNDKTGYLCTQNLCPFPEATSDGNAVLNETRNEADSSSQNFNGTAPFITVDNLTESDNSTDVPNDIISDNRRFDTGGGTITNVTGL